MDEARFDQFARLLAAPTRRRAWLGMTLALWFATLVVDEDGAARRKGQARRGANRYRRQDVAPERKKRKKKKKCKPGCVGRVCGANGCKGKKAGSCGECAPGTACNAAGQCVGCLNGSDCTARVCNSIACQDGACTYTPVGGDPACAPPRRCRDGQCVGCLSGADCASVICQAASCQNETCNYSPVTTDSACAAPRRCLAGQCVGCLSGGDCALRACNTESCQNETCIYTPNADGGSCGGPDDVCCGGACIDTATSETHCGACGNACSGGDTCQNGVCCTVCASGCAFTTVGAAVNAAAPGVTVRICPGTYVERIGVSRNLTLVGMGSSPGDTVITNAQGNIVSIQSANADITVTIKNLRVTGTLVSSLYGAMFSSDGVDLTLERVEITGNSVSQNGGSSGGAIFTFGKVTLIDSVVSLNNAKFGGGIYGFSGSTLTLTRSVVESNIATQGGGVWNGGTLKLNEASRIRNNQTPSAVGSGAGVYNNGGTVVLNSGSSIAGNTSSGNPDNCVNANGGTGCPA